MSNCSLQHIYRILVVILVVSLIENKSYGDYVTSLNSVPAMDKSIQRFPEPGSKYNGVLRDFRGIAYNSNVTKMVVVGSDGYMFRLDLKTFSIQNTSTSENIIKIVPDKKTLETCIRYNGKGECYNTMMGVVYNGTSEIFACGTYAKNPRCWMFSIVTLKMTRIVKGLEKDILMENEFCPKYEYGNLLPICAENGVIFGATDSLRNPDKHSIRGLFPNGEMIRSAKPKKHFKDPIFVWAYNGMDGFVYYFFYEIADEVAQISGRPATRYSRVGRICSYDRGPYIHSSELFMSYSKSQILCYKTENGVTDYYDHIQSATAVTMHDSTGKPETYIYAAFTTTLRSTGSSAICRYKFSDMTKVFQTSKYCSRKMGVTDCETPTYAKDPSVNVAKMKCDASLDTWKFMGWDPIWVNEYPLLHDDIESADRTTLVTFRGERVTAIAVDDLHDDVNKTDVGIHVIFAGTEGGKIFKIMMNSTNKGVPVFVEEIQAVKGSGAITRLQLYENYVIATARHIPLTKVAKERCESKFLLCSDCMKARDPYCAWSLSQKKCMRASDLSPSDRIQDIAVGSDRKCPPVDMHISCALEKIEDIPGAWTTLRCTGYGRVAPSVLAWRKGDSHLNIDNKNYEIRTHNKSSQLLIIKDYTMKHLGKYGCIVGIGINRSLCTLHVTGQKPEVNCNTNNTNNCSCEVTGFPLPSLSIVTTGNRTVAKVAKVDESGLVFVDPGVILFAYNSFGNDAFSCPVVAKTTVATTTTKATTTTLPTTLSTTQTTTESTSTSTTAVTTKPTTAAETSEKVTKPITTKSPISRTLLKTTQESTKTTQQTPATPGKRGACPKDADKYFVPFVVCLVLLILVIFVLILLLCCQLMRTKRLSDSDDEFDGRKGTLEITPQKATNRTPLPSFGKPKKRKKVEKTESSKPLMRKDKKEPQNGSTNNHSDNHSDSMKNATEMDDLPLNECSKYVTHIKT